MWCDRWYNYSYYKNINDLNCNTTVPNNDSSSDLSDHDENSYYSDHSVESNNECVTVPEKNSETISFVEVKNEAKKVIQYAASSQSELRKLFVFFCDMYQAQKQNKDLTLYFDSDQKKNRTPSAMVTESNYGNLGKVQPFSKKVKHKQSYLEKSRNQHNKSHHASKLPSCEIESDMKQKVATMEIMGSSKTKRFCPICRQVAHNRFLCPLLKKFGYVVNGRNENLCNVLVDELRNR